ncbi:hypothetical protein EVAR_54459_1 [Eumeta japonica]|uniref:Uncharacterized protein n=1 Tax=Eumeta variegata TaxID=151549 RepID=A0A4C1XN06_EUMVA|nr:hypothetical protein EVAR_54459_1 [Eumeta japonica]
MLECIVVSLFSIEGLGPPLWVSVEWGLLTAVLIDPMIMCGAYSLVCPSKRRGKPSGDFRRGERGRDRSATQVNVEIMNSPRIAAAPVCVSIRGSPGTGLLPSPPHPDPLKPSPVRTGNPLPHLSTLNTTQQHRPHLYLNRRVRRN